MPDRPRTCRVCGCTDDDCSGCIARTGAPCHWVLEDLCSACAGRSRARGPVRRFTPEEDALMERQRIAGMSLGTIAQLLGRSKSSVQMGLERLAAAAEKELKE